MVPAATKEPPTEACQPVSRWCSEARRCQASCSLTPARRMVPMLFMPLRRRIQRCTTKAAASAWPSVPTCIWLAVLRPPLRSTSWSAASQGAGRQAPTETTISSTRLPTRPRTVPAAAWSAATRASSTRPTSSATQSSSLSPSARRSSSSRTASSSPSRRRTSTRTSSLAEGSSQASPAAQAARRRERLPTSIEWCRVWRTASVAARAPASRSGPTWYTCSKQLPSTSRTGQTTKAEGSSGTSSPC